MQQAEGTAGVDLMTSRLSASVRQLIISTQAMSSVAHTTLGKSMAKKKDFKWEVRKTESGKWGVFLQQQFCRTDEPVCYAVSVSKASAQATVDRMNDPDYWYEED